MIILPGETWDGTAVEAIAAKMDEPMQHNWRLQSGKVFFKHRRAKYHLEAAQQTVIEMLLAMQPLELAGERVVHSSYSGPLCEVLFFHLDGFLEATRAAYDHLISFLISAKVVRHDSPLSITDFITNIKSKSSRANTDPPEIADLLAEFWSQTGKAAKDYRDCFTHHITFAGPTWEYAVKMTGTPDGWSPHVPWPDNPEAKSYVKLTFDKRLDAVAYCDMLYQKSDGFFRELVDKCLVKWNAQPQQDRHTFTRLIHHG